MRKMAICSGLTLIALCAACGSDESAFLAAISEKAAAGNHRVCEAGPLRSATIATVHGRGATLFLERRDHQAPLLDALVSDGLIGPAEQVQIGGGIKSRRITAHPIKDESKELFRYDGFGGSTAMLSGICFATRVPVEIIEYTEPADAMGQTMTQVTFTWAERPIDGGPSATIVGLIRGVSADGDEQKRGKAVLVKTNKGWRAEQVLMGSPW